MKAHYRRILYGDLADAFPHLNDTRTDTYDCELVAIEWCCDDAKQANENHLLGFGEEILTRTPNMNFYEYKWDSQYETPFAFCPWCASSVELIEDEVVTQVATEEVIPEQRRMNYQHQPVPSEDTNA